MIGRRRGQENAISAVRVLALDQVGVHTGRERILAEIGQAEQRREAHAAHAAHQGALLRV